MVLAFPVPFALRQSTLTWQAVDGFSFSQVGGSGPGSIRSRAGKEAAGQSYLASISAGTHPELQPAGVAATRQALDGWGVTTIVVPDTASLPPYEQLGPVRDIVVLMTAATGTAPIRQADAWVWTDVRASPAPARLSAARLTACTLGPQWGPQASIQRSAACVLAAPSAPR